MATAAKQRSDAGSRELRREWWIRLLVVLSSPASVFPLLRDQSDAELDARQDQVLAVVFLAGIATVLATPVAGRLANPPDGSLLVVAAWAVFAGAITGILLLYLLGALLHRSGRVLGSHGTYRRARQVLAFSAVPVALSLVVWPFRLLLYGGDVFRTGGSDHGAGAISFRLVELGFLLWSVALLVIGTRLVHGWPWGRAAGVVALALAVPALLTAANLLR